MKHRYPILVLAGCFVLVSISALAQRTLSGRVTDSGGSGMPGVNVMVKGTNVGTATDATGRYSIGVDGGEATTLVFSFIGYATQEIEIGNRTTVDVTMTEDTRQLDEVVVTALGVERQTKALQYSVTKVSGDNFTQARENNLGAALSGRIAGVNVSKVASGPAGSTRIVIRGNKTLGGQNQPLYVVDGMPIDNSGFGQAGLWGGRDEGDGLVSINPDDIESITVLKGANAAALYGSRGGNGVINIVTKKGSVRRGIGIEFNSNYVFERVNQLHDLQRKYGSGAYVDEVATAPRNENEAFDWADDSWGERLDPGRSVMQFDGVERPYAYVGDNWDRFYQTGSTFTNSLSFTGGGERQTFRVSVADLRGEGVVPNSGFDRTNVTATTSARFAEKLTLEAKVMYAHEYAKNRPVLSDSPGNAIQAMWKIPANINVETFYGDPLRPGTIPAGWAPNLLNIYGQGGDPRQPGDELLPAANNWGQNPYFAAYQMINDDTRDRIITQGQLRYDFTDFLYVSGRVSMDWFTRRDKSLTPQGTGYQLGGALTEGEDRVRETNMEWMLGFNDTFGKFAVNAFVGGNRMRRSSERLSLDGSGFNVDYFHAINNSSSRNFGYGFNEQGINSLFGSVEIGFNEYLFVTATGRQDWFSVLNHLAKNDIFYPSLGASFIFTEALTTPTWLSFGKVRASAAQVGFIGDLTPYNIIPTYSLLSVSHLERPMATFSFANNNNGNIINPLIKPATSTEVEIGLDLRFLNDRVGLDLTYYNQRTTDDILSATISRASGFGMRRVNVGEVSNKGVEVLLTGTPVRGPLTWDVSINFAKNNNKVVSLLDPANDNEELTLEEPRTRNVFIKHIEGYPFGMITGRVQQRTPDGTPIFHADGRPVASSNYVPIGNGIADWTGGINNAFSWKGFNLSFLIDVRIGGDIFSGTNDRLTQWGLHQQSLLGREGEAPLHVTGVVNVGTSAAPEYQTIDRDLTPQEARDYWNNVGGEATAISDMFVYDASYWKLRQVTLGYSLPTRLLANTPLQNVTLSLVGRNLAILHKNVDNIDPESAYSANAGAQGLEYFAMPATRSYGFNLRVAF